MRTLHLVSHTHWDREWYLTFQQFRLKLVHLVDNLLDILKSDERYLYFMLDGQTIVLEDYLAVRPDREEELRRYIRAGRILIGPWYILPDEFLVSPEATVRNLLEGERTSRLFGPKMMVGYIPDPFGHIGQLPQVLRGFGIETACVMRGLADEPCEFYWQAPDGSKVLMAYLRDGYGNAADILNGGVGALAKEAGAICQTLVERSASSHFLLMNGTDHMEPHAGLCAALDLAEGSVPGEKLVHSTLPAYFQALQLELRMDQLCTVSGELRSSKRHPLLPGVLSTRMWIKQRNRACESLLEKWAEPFSTWADRLADGNAAPKTARLRSPEDILRQAWRLLMQCHPHDSICGCSIDQVHEEMRPRFDQVEQIGEEITRQSLQFLSERITTIPGSSFEGAESAIVVFNPNQGLRTDLVSTVLEGMHKNGEFELIDENGKSLPFQKIGMGSTMLFDVVMGRQELLKSFGMVANGVLMNWKIRDIQMRCDGSDCNIEISLVEKGLVNMAAWEQGRQAVEAALKNPDITRYHLRGQTMEANQISFVAPEVPGLGYRTFWVRSKVVEQKAPTTLNPLFRVVLPFAARLAASPIGNKVLDWLLPEAGTKPPYVIENAYFQVAAQADGSIDVLDKATGLLYQGQNRLLDGGDRGDEYNYSPPGTDQVIAARLRGVRVEKGSVQQSLELRLEMTIPEELAPDRKTRGLKKVTLPVVSRVTLNQGVPRVEVRTEVENLARDHRLRVHFPAPFAASEGQHDGHFEVVHRPVGVPMVNDQWAEQPRPETCQRAFSAVDDGRIGLLVANRGLPEVEVRKRADENVEIAVTLLRCVGWLSRDDFPERKGHAGPGMAAPGAQMPGKWAFEYAIIPFRVPGALAAYQQAYAFETPLRAASAGLQNGVLPASGFFLQSSPDEFIISAVKAAEDGKGWLVRGYNLRDSDIVVTLRTLQPFQRAETINLAEQAQESLVSIDQYTVTLPVKSKKIVSLRFL